MKHFYLLFLLITPFCFSQEAYYNGIDFSLTGLSLKAALANKISSNNTPLFYSSSSFDTWDALKETDEDPDNTSNVLLIYSGSSVPKDNTLGDGNTGPEDWNREHVFARSLAGPSLETNVPGPGTDIQNLRASNPNVNSNRGSLKFADGNGSYGTVSGGWYPGDDWRGDVARMIMYMYVRYDGNGSSAEETYCWPSNVGVGSNAGTPDDMIDLFLEWNADDEVSTIEMQRNTVSENRQGNRNPFIDNPALATAIWGGPNAQDTWGNILSADNFDSLNDISMSPNPTKNKVQFSTSQDLDVIFYDVLGKQIQKEKVTSSQNTMDISNFNNGIYLVRLISEDGQVTKKLIKQ